MMAAIFVLATAFSASSASNESVASKVERYQVWMTSGLKWERDPGEEGQYFASARVLYFGWDGKFGLFSGVALKNGKRMGLSEGEGGTISGGTWIARGSNISVSYRLVDFYKVLLPAGKQPPAVPGPVEQGDIRNAKGNSKRGEPLEQLVFNDQTFVPAPTFSMVELRELLELHDKNNRGAIQPSIARPLS